MAEYYSTRQITEEMRAYVKSESRRIRLLGVRAKVSVLSFQPSQTLSCIKAFSWADITIVNKKLHGSEAQCRAEVERISTDKTVHGVIITGNPTEKMNIQALYDVLPYEKDVMCCGAKSVSEALCKRKCLYMPTMAEAVMRMLRYSGIEYSGKHIALFGVGNTIRALGFILMNAGCNVSLCANVNRCSRSIAEKADILITKLDIPNAINAAFMNERQIIIDLGRNTGSNGKITGDVVFKDAEKFIHGIFIGQEDCFSELMDYIVCSHVLKCAAENIIKPEK